MAPWRAAGGWGGERNAEGKTEGTLTPAVRRATGPHRRGRGRRAPHPDYTPEGKRQQGAVGASPIRAHMTHAHNGVPQPMEKVPTITVAPAT